MKGRYFEKNSVCGSTLKSQKLCIRMGKFTETENKLVVLRSCDGRKK